MFEKIEKSFTRYSLIILSLVVLISFVGIYIFVRGSIYSDIEKELGNLGRFLDKQQVHREVPREPRPKEGASFPMGFIADISGDTPVILTPFTGEFSDIPYDELIKTASTSAKAKATLSVESSRWRYSKMGNERIHFIEISRQTRILRTIVVVAVGTYIVLIAVFWWISRRLAKRAVEPARRAYQQQTEFIANVSHELKTPLAVIKTNAEAISLSPEKPVKDQIQWLDNIEKEVQRMNQLVSDMVDISLATEETNHPRPVALADLLGEVLLSFEPAIYEKQIQLETDVKEVTIKTDPDKLKRACYLLLENATVYTPEKGSIWVETHGQPFAGISVCNNGDGIDPSEVEKVFQRFYRGDSSRSRKNNSYGLGLPIAKQIVEGLGGKLELTVGERICFRIKL